MTRPAILLAVALPLATIPLRAQAHERHHHPRGAKIIMVGTLVNPVCAFAQQLADTAQARCSRQRAATPFQPVLLTSDGEVYLLSLDSPATGPAAPVHTLVGKHVKVDGTVYPAGNAYLIVVDSLRPSTQ